MARSLPRNAELAERFELLADMLELDGADAFRLAAYRRAATRIRESAVSVAELALEGKAQKLSGIGGTIEQKIVELSETGDLQALAKLRARIPVGLVEITHVPGLGPKTARKLWQELGIQSPADLRAAAEQGLLRGVPGLGAKTEQNVLSYFAKPPERASRDGRALLGNVLALVGEVVAELRSHPAAVQVSEAGSARRRTETVRDLDVIATATDAAALIEHFVALPWVAEVAAKGPTKATVVGHDGLRCDLRVVPPECYGNLLQHFTGSKDHNIALREDAVRRGLSVSEYGVEEVASGTVTTMATEAELYAHLGYAWIPPELRENGGELEAARDGNLPVLVERSDVLGDLHTHTDWSDGKATLEQMVAGAHALGHRYYAICDHAKRLKDGRLERQAEVIAGLNERLDGIELLSGVEVDIRANGSLDMDGESLAARDWVVASIHSGFRDPPKDIERRLLAAIDNPHVDCIGHLTGRKIGRRAAYDVDLEVIFARAAETGTALEINGQPDRLDLRDTHARLAAESGVLVVLSSDAHSVGALGYIDLAVAQARRGWLSASQILNARAWPEIAAARARR
jgi:DNA polymerase (family 10)